jgi:hypothetical protein
VLLSPSSPLAKAKFLIPNATFWEVAESALRGAWATVSDTNARTRYDRLVRDGILRPAVLEQASSGATITAALFHNAQNPHFHRHRLDLKEFVEAVGPAIELFSDTLGRLVQQMKDDPDLYGDNRHGGTHDEKEGGADGSADNGRKRSSSVFQLGGGLGQPPLNSENLWRKRAARDPDSLEAKLRKLTTDVNFDDHYYGALLFQALTAGTSHSTTRYIGGRVENVSLLSARAMPVPLPGRRIAEDDDDDDDWDEDEEGGTVDDKHIAARMDVLYEITQTFRKRKDPLSVASQYRTIEEGDNNDHGGKVAATAAAAAAAAEDDTKKQPDSGSTVNSTEEAAAASTKDGTKGTDEVDDDTKYETVDETTLAVAVLEGWLHGGPDNHLRWKVATIREAHEFQ